MVNDGESTHLAPKTDTKEHGKQVEMLGLMVPEEQHDGQPLQKKAQGHGALLLIRSATMGTAKRVKELEELREGQSRPPS